MIVYPTAVVMALHQARVEDRQRIRSGRGRDRKPLVTTVAAVRMRPAPAR